MLVKVKLPGGKSASIETSSVIRIRPSYGEYEISNTVFVDYVSGGCFSTEALDEVSIKFGKFIRLATLHSPTGTPVLLNADGIAAISPPNASLHNENARSVAIFKPQFINPHNPSRGQQQLQETEAAARAVLNETAASS